MATQRLGRLPVRTVFRVRKFREQTNDALPERKPDSLRQIIEEVIQLFGDLGRRRVRALAGRDLAIGRKHL